MIAIKINDQSVQSMLNRLAGRMGNLTPAMRELGEQLVRGTKRRFELGQDWDGVHWLPNTQATILNFLSKTKGNFTKKGGYSKKGMTRLLKKEPLTGESRKLRTTIFYQASATGVTIASPEEYAATQHFGAMRGAFGRTSRGSAIPWGNIPPRPFMPILRDGSLPPSAAQLVMDILAGYISPE